MILIISAKAPSTKRFHGSCRDAITITHLCVFLFTGAAFVFSPFTAGDFKMLIDCSDWLLLEENAWFSFNFQNQKARLVSVGHLFSRFHSHNCFYLDSILTRNSSLELHFECNLPLLHRLFPKDTVHYVQVVG